MIKLCLPLLMAGATALAVGTGGCSKATNSSTQASQRAAAFASVSSDLKAQWEKVTTAAATGDYATAIITCRELQGRTDLTPEQRDAINATVTATNNKMLEAAQKGDPKAKAALEEVRKNWGHR